MARKRLLNCEFVNASSFKVNISNKGKLLYLIMFANADDKGFVDSVNEIIQSLTQNDTEFRNEVNMELLENDYKSALTELIDKGLLFEFVDNHKNHIYLIRHWYYHNKMVKGLWTNYGSLLKQVEIVDNEYRLTKKSKTKENNNKINYDKLNYDKLSYDTVIDTNETEHNKTQVDFDSLSEEEQRKQLEDEMPF